MRARTLVTSLALFVTSVADAQHPAGAQQGSGTRAPAEARQYDFLIGQWDITVKPKVSGLAARIHGVPKLRGTWKAWRALDGWGVEDELRVIDESGNPRSLSHVVRLYDPTAKRWQLVSIDAYRQKVSQSTAQWAGDAMTSTGQAVDGDGKTYATRTRFAQITPTSFRYQQDRSYDNGKTWEDAILVMEAKRTSATAPR